MGSQRFRLVLLGGQNGNFGARENGIVKKRSTLKKLGALKDVYAELLNWLKIIIPEDFLSDNLGVTLTFERGRAKDPILLAICRRWAALSIAANIRGGYAGFHPKSIRRMPIPEGGSLSPATEGRKVVSLVNDGLNGSPPWPLGSSLQELVIAL